MNKLYTIILLFTVFFMGCTHTSNQEMLTDNTDEMSNITNGIVDTLLDAQISTTPEQVDDILDSRDLTESFVSDDSTDIGNQDEYSNAKDSNDKNSIDEYYTDEYHTDEYGNDEYDEHSNDEYKMGTVPKLIVKGAGLDDFICEGWSLLDHVSFDFNDDGIDDFVGILEHPPEVNQWYPQILFAIKSNDDGLYTLDFQDTNLIRIYGEGGMNPEPNLPLKADNHSFTISAYGGSAWKWYEKYTYEYINGEWYLIENENINGYGDWQESYFYNDYIKGSGIRKYNYGEIQYLMRVPDGVFDLVFEVPLDPAPTLTYVSENWIWTDMRIGDITNADITKITISKSVDISINDIPSIFKWPHFIDVNNIIYVFTSPNRLKEYLAVYDRNKKSLSIISEAFITEDYRYSSFGNIKVYKDMIYCVETSSVDYKIENSTNEIYEYNGTSYERLIRLNLDGTSRQIVFEYDNNYDGNEFQDSLLSFVTFNYEITGDEIIIRVYIGDKPHLFYRMKLDGSGCQYIGTLSDGY